MKQSFVWPSFALAFLVILLAAWAEATTYTYDPLKRLTVTEYVWENSITHGYDDLGNRTSEVIVVLDSDGDGLSDALEEGSCTDLTDSDSDDDGITDGVEDANLNGAVDPGETDPCLVDSDGDGIQDGTELGYTLETVDLDTDLAVFIPDEDPASTTDPLNTDSDGDGLLDGEEDTNFNGMVDPGETDPAPKPNMTPMLFLLLSDESEPDQGDNSTSPLIFMEQEIVPE